MDYTSLTGDNFEDNIENNNEFTQKLFLECMGEHAELFKNLDTELLTGNNLGLNFLLTYTSLPQKTYDLTLSRADFIFIVQYLENINNRGFDINQAINLIHNTNELHEITKLLLAFSVNIDVQELKNFDFKDDDVVDSISTYCNRIFDKSEDVLQALEVIKNIDSIEERDLFDAITCLGLTKEQFEEINLYDNISFEALYEEVDHFFKANLNIYDYIQSIRNIDMANDDIHYIYIFAFLLNIPYSEESKLDNIRNLFDMELVSDDYKIIFDYLLTISKNGKDELIELIDNENISNINLLRAACNFKVNYKLIKDINWNNKDVSDKIYNFMKNLPKGTDLAEVISDINMLSENQISILDTRMKKRVPPQYGKSKEPDNKKRKM